MSDIIPVIVHHETGEKPQTGGKKNQEYLRSVSYTHLTLPTIA